MAFHRNKTKWLIAILITILASQSLLGAQATAPWRTQIVDPLGAGGTIVIDSQNKPHIFYYEETATDVNNQPKGLSYAVWTGQNWKTQQLNYTIGNIFIMDTNNKPHIISTANGTLTDTPITGSDWNLNSLGATSVAGDLMKLDSKGNLHVVSGNGSNYFQGNNSYDSYLYYDEWTKAGESSMLITERNSTAQVAYDYLYPVSLALDPQNNPEILFVEQIQTVNRSQYVSYPIFFTANKIEFAKWTGKGWSFDTVATNSSDANGVGSLVLDSKGLPHLCYIQDNQTTSPETGNSSNQYAIGYTYFDGSNWVTKTVENGLFDTDYSNPTLRLDSNGNPQVFYYREDYQNQAESGLIAATWSGTGWDIQNLGTVPSNGYGPASISSMAFDSNGNPRLLYSVVVGTYESASRSGNLTYASLIAPQYSQPQIILLTATVVIILAVVTTFIIYRVKHKSSKGTSHAG